MESCALQMWDKYAPPFTQESVASDFIACIERRYHFSSRVGSQSMVWQYWYHLQRRIQNEKSMSRLGQHKFYCLRKNQMSWLQCVLISACDTTTVDPTTTSAAATESTAAPYPWLPPPQPPLLPPHPQLPPHPRLLPPHPLRLPQPPLLPRPPCPTNSASFIFVSLRFEYFLYGFAGFAVFPILRLDYIYRAEEVMRKALLSSLYSLIPCGFTNWVSERHRGCQKSAVSCLPISPVWLWKYWPLTGKIHL